MNIKDLPTGSYQPVAAPKLNINSLPKGSVQPAPAPVAPAPTTRNALSSTPVIGQLSDAGIGAGTAIAKTLTGIPEAMSRGIGGALGGLAKIGPKGGIGEKGLSSLSQSFVHNADKIAQYKENQFTKPYEKSLDTVSGQVGTVVGNVAPYFLTAPALAATKAPLLARAAAAAPSVLADTAISQAQSGGDLATGGATAITSAVGNTIVPGGGGLAKRMLKGAVPGYTGDVAMGMAGQRGEDRTGAKAFVPGLGTALGAGFSGAGYIKSPERKVARAEKTIKGREAVLQRLEDNYSTIKKVTENASKRGIDPKKLLAGGDLLVGSVDNAGTIRTTGEGGAIEQLNNFIKPQENIVSKKLQQEGATIPLAEVHKLLKRAVMDSGLQGGALTRALQNVESDIAGYAMRADKSGNIPLSTVHSAKVDKYANINYLNPESKRADKVIAKTLKLIVEDNSSVEVKKLNEELSRHYAALNLLEKLDGKKVEGGRLGKLFAQTIGGMVGSHFGPLGTIAGAEIGGAAKGAMMKSTFGKKTGNNLVRSELMNKNIQSTDTALGMRNQSQSTQKITTSPTGITPTVLPKTPKPKPVVPITEPSRLLAEPSKVTPLGGETIAGKVDASGSLIPHRVGKSGVSLVPAEKGMVGVDPKTKKFMRTYKSGFASRTTINTLGGAATGALAGVETDQNGKKTYNWKKGLGGAVAGGVLGYGVSKGKLGLSAQDVTKDYDTVAKKLMEYDTKLPTVNTGGGMKMAAPLSEDANTLMELKTKLEKGVLTKEEIATAGRLLQKERAFDVPKVSEVASSAKTPLGKTPIRGALGRFNGSKAGETSAENLATAKQALTEAKGLSASDIMAKHPDINLKRDVPITDIRGNKAVIPAGEALTPYELKGNKVLLQDGETYIVSKNQWQNIKGNAVSGEAKEFAPELKGTEETVMGHNYDEKIYNKYVEDLKKKYDPSGRLNMSMLYDELSATEKAKFDAMKTGQDTSRKTATKYSSYTLPDGKNYKEVLIKAPKNTSSNAKLYPDWKIVKPDNSQFFHIENGKGERVQSSFDTKEQAQHFLDMHPDNRNFKSSHWDEPNVISHLRLNERTYKGKPVTFMEELQSDWAREGRSKGFIGDNQKVSKQFGVTIGDAEPNIFFNSKAEALQRIESIKGDFPNQKLGVKEVERVARIGTSDGGVPNNPLLKNWQTLSVKRALQEAALNKSEYFAWINGEQTSARYNLATHVKEVSWNVGRDAGIVDGSDTKVVNIWPKDDKKLISVLLDPKTGVIKDVARDGAPSDWKGKKLDEVLGKGLADSIMSKESGTLSGDGLKFGGEWANTLYDKQVKNIVEDVTGGRVEMMDLGLPTGDKVKQWASEEWGTKLSYKQMETEGVGLQIRPMEGGQVYVVTDILGDGKFKAVTKRFYDSYDGGKGLDAKAQVVWDDLQQTFDISQKTTTQQGIRLTPEIIARIKGEAPVLKKPSGKSPLGSNIK